MRRCQAGGDDSGMYRVWYVVHVRGAHRYRIVVAVVVVAVVVVIVDVVSAMWDPTKMTTTSP